jgi:periplasmic divalent cation tolerance protein
VKTSVAKQQDALKALTELHPYDTPEGIALPVVAGLEKYLAWLGTSLGEDCDSLG